MAEPLINRVYDLKIAGYDDAIQKVEALTLAFKKMDDTKRLLNSQLQQKVDAGDQTAVNDLTKQIKDLQAEMTKLKTQRDSAAKEAALLAKAEKDTAAALLLTEKATVATATAEKIRATTVIAQNTERQKQLDLEEKQRIKLENEKKAVDALEGSYALLKQRRKELEALTGLGNATSTITFENQTFSQDEAIAKIKELKAQEQEYTDKLRIEKVVQEDLVKNGITKIAQLQQERVELEQLISSSQKNSVISFQGQTFNNEEALSKITQMRQEEELLTQQLNNERNVRQSLIQADEQRLSLVRQERVELQNTGNNSSDSVARVEQLKAEETQLIEKLQQEKTIHDQITATDEQRLIALREQRTLLENSVNTAAQNTSVSFNGEDLNRDEAIAKAQQLRAAEAELTAQLLAQQKTLNPLTSNFHDLAEAERQAVSLFKVKTPDSPFFDEVKAGAVKAANAVSDFNRTLRPDGTLIGEYKTGIINAFKELGLSDVLRKQRDEINSQLNQLKTQSQELAAEYRKTGVAGQESFSQVDKQLQLNLQQQEQLKKSLQSLDSALNNTGNVGSQISNSIANGFKNAKTQISQLLVGYVGFQAVFSGLQSGVGITKELADSTSNLEIELGKTAGGATKIVDELAKINTRTKLTGLEDIANIAAKAGVSEEKLVGVTRAIDKIKIAFGKDFGDVEQGTESLVKIVNIFEGTDKVTGDNLLRTGNAIRTLANESVASVPFINDFSRRMAGLKGISDISLPAVLGLASGFEQFGQSAEVSSTSLVRIIPKLASDTAKFSEIAGVTQKEFSDLLKNNPAEALIKVAQGFTAGKSSIEEFEATFKDSGLGTGRVSSVIGVLGKNADEFRHSIDSAGKSFSNTANIEEAFTAKNENLAGTLDKIGKKFSDAAGTRGFQIAVTAVASVITLLITNIPTLLTILGVLAVSWAVQNTALIALRAQVLGYNILIGLSAIAQVALTAANGIYVAGLFLLNGAYTIVTKTAALFNLTLGRTPIGLILTGIGLLLTAYKAFGSGLNESIIGLRNFNEAAKINRDIIAEAAKATSEARAQAQLYAKVVKDTTISETTRLATLQKLINIDPSFQAALVNGKINYQELDKALTQYNNSLIKSSELEAAKARQSGEFKKLTDLQVIKQDIEFAKSTRDLSNLSDEAKNLLAAAAIKNGSLLAGTGGADLSNAGLLKQADNAIKLVNEQIDKQSKTVDAAQQVFIEKQKTIDDDIAAANAKAQAAAAKTPPKIIPAEIDVDALKKQIADYDDQINVFKGSQKDLDKLIADRKKLQDELDAALGKDNTGKPKIFRGSRLTGEQKDDFKEIDAIKDEQITEQKLLFKQLTIDEEVYLKNILKINEDAADKKLAILNKKPAAQQNAEEKKQVAELQLFKIEQEEETDKKLFDIKKRELDAEFQNIKKQAELELATTINDPLRSESQKAKAKEDFLNNAYILQVLYNKKFDDLQKQFNQKSVTDAQKNADDLTAIEIEKQRNKLAILNAGLKDADVASNKLIDEAKQRAAESTTAVLEDSSLSPIEQARKIHEIQLNEQKLFLAQQEAADRIALALKQKALKDGLATEGDVAAARRKLAESTLEFSKFTSETELSYFDKLKGGLKEVLNNFMGLFTGFKKSREEIQADLENATQQAGQIINNAISQAEQTFFDSQKQKADDEKAVALQRLDIQQQQAINLASSEAEKDSITRQFDAKRKEVDKKAAEQKKKSALSQIAIDYAISIMKSIAQYGLPIALIPIAAETVLYFIQRAAIQKQQFAAGGYTGPGQQRDDTGHRVAGIVHEDEWVAPKWIVKHAKYGPVIRELEDIRKKGSSTVTIRQTAPEILNFRTHAENAKKAFASGGFTGLGGEVPGLSLQAPINPSSFLNPQSAGGNNASSDKTEKQLNILMGLIAETSRQTNQRIDQLKVQVVTQDVTKSQNQIKKASAIGKL